MLEVRDLTTHYGSSQALFGINLKIEAGQVATLLGRNGMGKTTTINSIMGIVPASGGSVTFDGQELFFAQRQLLGGPAPVRRFLPDLIDGILTRAFNPGKVFDLEIDLKDVAEGYAAMDERRAIKTLLRV